MRNSHNITLTNNDSLTEDEETTWSLPGATWPFFLALMPVAVVVGIALHSLMDGKLRYSIVFTLVTVGIMFGALFMWLLG